MKKYVILLILLMLGICVFTQKGVSGNEKHTMQLFAMDTYMSLTAYGPNGEAALKQAEAEILRLEQELSASNSQGQIGLLNQNGFAVINGEVRKLLDTAIDYYYETKGSFNIAIYPLMTEWGFIDKSYRVPSHDAITKLLQNIDVENISFLDDGMVTLPDGMQIDLGGIAKGYLSDRLMDIFRENKVQNGIVNLGGNVHTIGSRPDGNHWRVGITNPQNNQETCGMVTVKNKAVITSGGYERYFEQEGVRYHHIIDPKTGYPANTDIDSVTIVCENGTHADTLSTTLFIYGKDAAINYWKARNDFEMIIICDNIIYITEGLKNSFFSDFSVQIIKHD